MMPTKQPKRPRDVNQLAKHMVDVAIGAVSDEPPAPQGKAIGGHARAASMTSEERRAHSRMMLAARRPRSEP